MDSIPGKENCMKKELIMYYPPDLEILFVPTEKEYMLDYIDNYHINRLLQMHQEINDKVKAGLYDRI